MMPTPTLQRLPAKAAIHAGQQTTNVPRNVCLAGSLRHGMAGIASRKPQPSRMRAVQVAANVEDYDPNNPDIDDIQINNLSREELGLEDDEDFDHFEPDDLDPEGRELRLEDFYTVKEGTPESLVYELYSDDVYGPPVSNASHDATPFAFAQSAFVLTDR